MDCLEGTIPMMSTNNGKLLGISAANLPIVESAWGDFTRNNIKGSFEFSIVPIIYSISALAVVTWFLTFFILTSYTIKSSLLLKSLTILSSIFLLIVTVRSIYELHKQQLAGYLSGTLLLTTINNSVYLKVIDLVAVILLQTNQVQVLMRLFSRQSDKRLTLSVGVTASFFSQIVWAISKFYNFPSGSETGDILPTFIYLTRTSMAICYAALISAFLIFRMNHILANKDIWPLTFLTFVMLYGPVAFFVSDVANAFIYELSEIFSVVLYVACVVIPWEWCNKYNVIMKAKEKEGILGRRFYEDELYQLDGLELFVEEEDSDNDADNDTRKKERLKTVEASNKGNIASIFDTTKRTFVELVDTIIATGFAIPRSASIPSATSPYNQHADAQENIPLLDLVSSRTDELRTDASARNRRDVFVYSTKQVIVAFSDDESNNETPNEHNDHNDNH